MPLTGPDLVMTLPTNELFEPALEPNAARRKKGQWVELPELAEPPYAGFSSLLVRTALVRSAEYSDRERPRVTSPDSAAEILRHLRNYDQEHLVTLCLDNKNSLAAIHEAAIGGSAALAVEPRHIVKIAVLTGATAIVVAHNHPSGDPEPSPEDVEMTAAVRALLKMLGVAFLDHIVIGRQGWSSFIDESINAWTGERRPFSPRTRDLYEDAKRRHGVVPA